MEKSLRRHLTSGLVLILIVAGLSYWLHERGFLVGFESLALETFAIMHEKKIPAPDVSIITISDSFYSAHFQGQYPLHGKPLVDLIGAIAKGQPRVIAVDLDNSLWDDADVSGLPTNTTIVWARDIRRRGGEGHKANEYCGLGVLGNRKGLDDQFTGVAAFPADVDGVVRLYPRFLRIWGLCDDPTAGEKEVHSFPWAVACAYRGKSVTSEATGDSELILNFLGEAFVFPSLEAEDVMEAASAEDSVWATKGPLKGRIALLGGSYHAAHDEHATPRGLIGGYEIAAQAIETELTNGGIRAANEGRMVLVEIGLGSVLLLIGFYVTARWALLANIAVFMLLAPVASYLSFSTKAEWANFVPMFFAMVIHSLYHEATQSEHEEAEKSK